MLSCVFVFVLVLALRYHCAVEVYGYEWSFGWNDEGDTGVFACLPQSCEAHTYKEVRASPTTRRALCPPVWRYAALQLGQVPPPPASLSLRATLVRGPFSSGDLESSDERAPGP